MLAAICCNHNIFAVSMSDLECGLCMLVRLRLAGLGMLPEHAVDGLIISDTDET